MPTYRISQEDLDAIEAQVSQLEAHAPPSISNAVKARLRTIKIIVNNTKANGPIEEPAKAQNW